MPIIANILGQDYKVQIGNALLTDVLVQLTNTYINTSEEAPKGTIDFIGYHSIGKVWLHCHYRLSTYPVARVVFDSWALEYDNDGEPLDSGTTLNSLLVRMGY